MLALLWILAALNISKEFGNYMLKPSTRRKGALGLTVRPLASSESRMTQFLRDQACDSEEVVTPLMLDGTYLSRNFATLGPLT